MPHYKLVRGFDQIDIKDTKTGEYSITGCSNILTGKCSSDDRFSVWTKINRVKNSYSIKDAKELQIMLEKWKNEGFAVVADSTQYKAMRYYR